MESNDLRFPVGRFEAPVSVTPAQVAAWIDEIAALPAGLDAAVRPLTPAQLETPYRPAGWCVRQVVHHIADSHLNSLLRFKLALTEDRPVIKPYREELWAELKDYTGVPVEASLRFIGLLHERWVTLLRGLDPVDLRREFVHPDSGIVRLDVNVGIYAWHGRHHLAHITRLAEREGWTR